MSKISDGFASNAAEFRKSWGWFLVNDRFVGQALVWRQLTAREPQW
jgi:hypothetical protein